MNIYFTSDWHLNHRNIITYCNRPFRTLEEMNNTIIDNFNTRVKPDDMIFFLGDFLFHSSSNRGEGEKEKAIDFLKRLYCNNIVFVQGNHDKNNGLRTPITKLIIRYGGKDICLVHNAKFADFSYKFHIVGHEHHSWRFKTIREKNRSTDLCNVSVECWNYRPIDINEINQAYSEWKNEKKT